MRSIEKTEDGLWIAGFPYFTLGTVRYALAESLEGRWMVLPVKGDSKAAEMYRRKLEDFGIDARSMCNGSSAVAVPGSQVLKLVEYGVGKLRQNMAGVDWKPEDFDREWLDAGRVTKKNKTPACSWQVTSDASSAAEKLRLLHECYGTSTAFVHDPEGSWSVLYTYNENILLNVAGDLANLAQWMEAALAITADHKNCTINEFLAGREGISVDDRMWHGFPCISRIRVPVHLAAEYWKAGMSDDHILSQFPYLRAKDLDVCRSLLMDLKNEAGKLPRGMEETIESAA